MKAEELTVSPKKSCCKIPIALIDWVVTAIAR
jgi:hypothetical protein